MGILIVLSVVLIISIILYFISKENKFEKTNTFSICAALCSTLLLMVALVSLTFEIIQFKKNYLDMVENQEKLLLEIENSDDGISFDLYLQINEHNNTILFIRKWHNNFFWNIFFNGYIAEMELIEI